MADQLKRIDIRAPQDGKVHQLSVHTVGGVITPNGEPLMLIVPKADALTVEARIAPQEIRRSEWPQPRRRAKAHRIGSRFDRGGAPVFGLGRAT